MLELETDGALHVQADVPGACTIFIAADVDELERRLRERATESTGEIGERIAIARHQLEQAHRFRYMVRNDDVSRARARCSPRSSNGSWSSQVPCSTDDRTAHRRPLSHTGSDTDPPSRYALVIMAAKRARQINNYHHQLGEGIGLEDAPPPLVESRSKNYLTMAMEEISQGKLTFTYAPPARRRHRRRVPRAHYARGANPRRRDGRHRRLQGL